jgi:hypothetical protein
LELSEMVIDELKYIIWEILVLSVDLNVNWFFFTVPSQQTAVKVTMSQYRSQFWLPLRYSVSLAIHRCMLKSQTPHCPISRSIHVECVNCQ